MILLAGGNIAKSINDNFNANGVNYQLETDFSNPYLGAQVRPAANWFTVGTGIIVPKNDIKVRSNNTTDGVYRVDGKDYKQSHVVQLTRKLQHRNKLAPYLTLGFRRNLHSNWGVFGEVGAAYLGKVDATVDAQNPTKSVTATDSKTQATVIKIAKQAERDIEDKKYANWFPIAKVGVTYRF